MKPLFEELNQHETQHRYTWSTKLPPKCPRSLLRPPRLTAFATSSKPTTMPPFFLLLLATGILATPTAFWERLALNPAGTAKGRQNMSKKQTKKTETKGFPTRSRSSKTVPWRWRYGRLKHFPDGILCKTHIMHPTANHHTSCPRRYGNEGDLRPLET